MDNELLADTKLIEWEVSNNIDQRLGPRGVAAFRGICLLNLNNLMWCVYENCAVAARCCSGPQRSHKIALRQISAHNIY